MAITFVGSDVGGGNVATLPAGDLVWPTVQADDFALLAWTMSDGSTATTPSGFTQIITTDITSGTGRTYLFRKYADGTEDGTDVGCTVSAANRQSACLVVYRGVHLTSPISGSVAVQQSAASTAHACAAATPDVANCVAITTIHERLSTGDTAWTPPSGYTERADTLTEATGNGGSITGVADDGLASGRDTSAVTPPDWTGTVSTDAVLTYTLMLRPADSGVTGTLATTLAGATLAASGTETITGTATSTLSGVTLAATATETISGTLATTLAGATLAATGSSGNDVSGTLATTLAGVTLAASGVETLTGTLASTFAGVTLAGSGVVANPVTGTLATTLAGAALVAAGTETISGTLAATLDGVTLAAAGLVANPVTGTLAVTLAGATLAATAAVTGLTFPGVFSSPTNTAPSHASTNTSARAATTSRAGGFG